MANKQYLVPTATSPGSGGGGGGGTPASPNTSVQFNNAGSFGGSANLTFASNILSLAGRSSFLHTSTATPTADFTFAGSGSGTIFGFPTVIDLVQENDLSNGMTFRNQVAINANLPGGFLFVTDAGAFEIGNSNTSGTSTPGQLVFAANGDTLLGGGSDAGTIIKIASGTTGEINLNVISSIIAGGPILSFSGRSTGKAAISVADAAGTPNTILLPTLTGSSGTFLTTNGANPQVTSWSTIPAASLSNIAGGTILGNATTGSAAVTATTAPVLGIPGTSTGTIALASSTASGKYTITAPANAATPTLTLPTSSGTFCISAATGLTLNSTTGQMSIDTSTASINWGLLLSASQNLALSNAGFTSTFNQTSAVNWTWANTTAATATVPQSSPIFNLSGKYWSGASSTDTWALQAVMGSYASGTTNAVSILAITHSGSPANIITADADFITNSVGTFYNNGLFANYSTTSPVTLTGVVGYVPFLTDAVPYGNGDLHTSNTSWVYQTGTFTVNANRIFSSAAGTSNTYRSDIASGTDQWAQVTAVVGGTAATQNCGPAVRMSTSAQTFYGVQFASATFNILKLVAGVTTTLATGAVFPVTGDTVRLEAIGTTLIAYINGTVRLTATDTAISSGQVGFWGAGNSTTNGASAWSGANNTADTGVSRVAAGVVGIGTGAAAGITGNLQLNTITSYGGTTTVGQGVASEIVTVDLTAQTAAIGATNLTASAPRTGMYRIAMSATITTADGATSVLGGTNGFQIGFTSPTDSVAKLTVAGNSTTSAANTTGTAVSADICVYAKTGTAITYRYDYTSGTPGTMTYELHLRLEAL